MVFLLPPRLLPPMANGIIKRAQKKMRRSAAHTHTHPLFLRSDLSDALLQRANTRLGVSDIAKMPHKYAANKTSRVSSRLCCCCAARRRSRNFFILPQLTREKGSSRVKLRRPRARDCIPPFLSATKGFFGAITVHVAHQ